MDLSASSIFLGLSGMIIGGLVSTVVFMVRVLPCRVTRNEVGQMLQSHPIHTRVAELEAKASWAMREMTSLGSIISGLRADVAKLTAVVEVLTKRIG